MIEYADAQQWWLLFRHLFFAWVLVFYYRNWTPFSILILTRSVSELSHLFAWHALFNTIVSDCQKSNRTILIFGHIKASLKATNGDDVRTEMLQIVGTRQDWNSSHILFLYFVPNSFRTNTLRSVDSSSIRYRVRGRRKTRGGGEKRKRKRERKRLLHEPVFLHSAHQFPK